MCWAAFLGAVLPGGISPDGHIGSLASAIVVYVVFLVAPLVLIGVARLRELRHRRQAANAEAAHRPHASLDLGLTTLCGRVEELSPGVEHAVRVEVAQEGSEAEQSGQWSHVWKEKDRRVKVHPFYLRHTSGRRVRVEPHREVLFIDEMDGVIRVNLNERVRVAELKPGEEVFAHGELRAALDPMDEPGLYREAPSGLVLRPPRGGRMLLSTEPLGERFLRRARSHHNAMKTMAVLLLLLNLSLLPYHLRALAGATVLGEVVALNHYTTGTRYDLENHYKVRVTIPGGTIVEDHLTHGVFRTLQRGARIPVRRSPVWPALLSNVGSGASAPVEPIAVGGVLWGLFIIGYFFTTETKRWFEAPVIDVQQGRLRE